MRVHGLIALGLLASVFVVYAPLRQHDFVDYDDPVYVEQLRPGLSREGLERALGQPVVSNWIPVSMLSLLVGQALHGEQAGAHLLVNAALHAGAALALYAALVLATAAPWPSAFVAGVFALHPLHVESVAWFSQRKDVLCGFFWMATLLAHGAWVRQGGAARYAAVLLGTLLALLSKPMAVTLPFTLLLFDYWPLGRLAPPGRRLPAGAALATAVREKLPLFALAALVSAITYRVQSATGAVAAGDLLPLDLRAANAVRALVDYLADAFWPSGLAVFYPHPREGPSALWLAGAGLGLGALTAIAVQQARRRPALAVGWLWFLGTLVPVLGLVQVGAQARADRYTYVPLIGLALAVAFGARDDLREHPRARRALAAAACAALVALAVAAREQVGYWRDSGQLFARALAVTRDNAFAHRGLARALRREGRLDEAEAELAAALRLAPDPEVRRELAEIRAGRGDVEGAIEHYRALLRADPGDLRSRVNLGQLLVRAQRYDEARAQLADVLARSGDGAALPRVYRRQLHMALASALAAAGEDDAARAQALAAGALDPSDPGPEQLLAELALRAGRRDEARVHWVRASGLAERRGDDARAAALRARAQALGAGTQSAGEGARTSSSTDSSPGTPTRSGKP